MGDKGQGTLKTEREGLRMTGNIIIWPLIGSMIVIGSGNGNIILLYICTYPGRYSGITLGAEFKIPIETTDLCCLDLYVIKVSESLGKAMCLKALIEPLSIRKNYT
jgi:hypothetical protein